MILLILTTVIGVCSAGVLNKAYLPPNSQSAAGAYQGAQGPAFGGPRNSDFSRGPANSGGGSGAQAYSQGPAFSQGSSRAQVGSEGRAAILRQDSDITPEGYHSSYETENGIKAEESAQTLNGVQAQGGFSYTGDDGQQYSITYTADENGFQPQGAHLPTAPPIPEEILKALEQNARDEAAGIVDDGSYNEGKYGGPQGQNSGPSQQYGAPQRAQGQFNEQTGYRY